MNNLYLASQSESRKKLLQNAGISFQVIEQNSDESKCDWNLPLQQVVEGIARYKMDHIIMPSGKENEIAFVLTADTLGVDPKGTIRGKPQDKEQAKEMLKAACGINQCGTAFCLDKKIFINNEWQVAQRHIGYAQATYEFFISDEFIEAYIERAQALKASGAIKVEDGAQFLKMVHGSYSAITGLPMFELWQALITIGFF